jgi:hypothetical protein
MGRRATSRQTLTKVRRLPHSPTASTPAHARPSKSQSPLEGMTVDPGSSIDPSLAVLKGIRSGFANCESPLDNLPQVRTPSF